MEQQKCTARYQCDWEAGACITDCEFRESRLVYAGGELLFVPGLGMATAQCASGPTPRLQLRWESDQPQ